MFDSHKEKRKKLSRPRSYQRTETFIGFTFKGNACFGISFTCDFLFGSRLSVRRINVDNEPPALFWIVDDLLQPLRQPVEAVVEEVKLEHMRVKKICAKLDALVDDIDILLVEGGNPNAVLVREADHKIGRAAAAVPHVVFVLPVFAKDGGKIVLRKRDPYLRREERSLALAHILRHEQVAAVDDIVPIFPARRTLVAVPEETMRFLPVGKGDFGKELKA